MTRILYIAGTGRSGSTLLGRLLGELPGFVYVGELRLLFSHGVLEDEVCGCGQRFAHCGFWRRVADAGGLDADRANRVTSARWIHRIRNLPLALVPALRDERYREAHATYASGYLDAYRVAGEVAQAKVVVDSSSSPLHALLLREVPELDFSVLHLVRDARAVSYAWTLVRPQPGSTHRPFLPRYGPRTSATTWLLKNAIVEATKRGYHRHVRVRYEDFCERPADGLARVVEGLGFPRPELPTDGDVFHVGTQHSVVGNPGRLDPGPVSVALDDRWRTAMNGRDRRLVTAITFPLLLRYGYRLWTQAG